MNLLRFLWTLRCADSPHCTPIPTIPRVRNAQSQSGAECRLEHYRQGYLSTSGRHRTMQWNLSHARCPHVPNRDGRVVSPLRDVFNTPVRSTSMMGPASLMGLGLVLRLRSQGRGRSTPGHSSGHRPLAVSRLQGATHTVYRVCGRQVRLLRRSCRRVATPIASAMSRWRSAQASRLYRIEWGNRMALASPGGTLYSPPTWWQVAVFNPRPPNDASDAITQAVFRVNRVSTTPTHRRRRERPGILRTFL